MATEGSKSASLPPYPLMILEAVESLKQAEGVTKSAISNYIESEYEEMPADHIDLLSHHLTRMVDNGDLLFIKNNYLKPGSQDAPPKRGRGRPPKPKEPLPPSSVPPPTPRPRGRPRKDPNASPAAKKPKQAPAGSPSVSKTGRPRGRPRKVNVQPLRDGVEA